MRACDTWAGLFPPTLQLFSEHRPQVVYLAQHQNCITSYLIPVFMARFIESSTRFPLSRPSRPYFDIRIRFGPILSVYVRPEMMERFVLGRKMWWREWCIMYRLFRSFSSLSLDGDKIEMVKYCLEISFPSYRCGDTNNSIIYGMSVSTLNAKYNKISNYRD